jgi:phosphate transport system substrate-binding protein
MQIVRGATARQAVLAVTVGMAIFLPNIAVAEGIRIGGTGAALEAMRILADQRPDPKVPAEVLPSLGTAGGIEALADGVLDVAVAARPLKPAEAAKGVREATCVVTPLVFATSHHKPASMQLSQFPEIYADPRPTWPDGTPLRIILRSRAGSENPYLAKVVPGFGPALDAAYTRPGLPVGATDQENVDLALRIQGSLTPTTLLQIRAERLPLQVVPLDGVEPTAEAVLKGSYPLSFRLCLLLSATPSAEAQAFVAHAMSEHGIEILRTLGAAPENNGVK